MNRHNHILKNQQYQKYMEALTIAEKDRIFCIHDIEHCLDVARIAYILNLENNIGLERDVVYGTALLHDIGRAFPNEDHQVKSAELSRDILAESGYSLEETELICDAIENHRCKENTANDLSGILARADNMARQCYSCKAQRDCYWDIDRRNMEIKL